MLNYSFSTVLMTVLASNLLIIVISFCFRDQEIMLSIGYKLVTLFLTLTVLRCIVPFEFPFAKNIYFSEWLSAIVALLRHSFFSFGFIHISIWFFIGWGWAIGTIYHLCKIVAEKKVTEHYIARYSHNITDSEPYKSIMIQVEKSQRLIHECPLWIYRVFYSGTPMQVGTIYPSILIPYDMDLPEEKLVFVLHHEATHFYRHDTLVKDVISIICAIYWWNPLCKRLKKQVDLLSEMHVDHQIIKGDAETRRMYCEVLDDIAAQSARDSDFPALQANSATGNNINQDLEYRYKMMFRQRGSNILLAIFLTILVLFIYIGSYRYTFEAHYMLPQHFESFESVPSLEEDIYAIPLKDGTYDIYIYGIFDTNTDSLEQYRGIQIKKP